VIVEPTGIQYLVFNAYEVAGIVLRSRWDDETAIWYVWILSPLHSIMQIYPDGQVSPMRSSNG
jgi:hypothetical protein